MAPESIEKFKNVAGGENTLIEVKHKASMTIARTPLIFGHLTTSPSPYVLPCEI